MKRTTKATDQATKKSLSQQIAKHLSKKRAPNGKSEDEPYSGSDEHIISTGSTLLDLAISGGRIKGGGIPSGILVEIFGPASCGKTVLLCEIAGAVKRQGGQVMFCDPEARLNKRFARLFGLDIDEVEYGTPDTISEVFGPIRKWEPEPAGKVHGIFADSLAALTTEWEMEDRDQYGMRRAKEFSEQCRLTCRILARNNLLMVCSNQVRQNLDAGPYGQKYKSPGGEAIGFYASLRLRCLAPKKIKRERKIAGKKVSKVVGVETEIEIFKSSVWKPYHTAPIYILYDYGIDDIRANLQYIKSTTGATKYAVGDQSLGVSIEDAILQVEEDDLEDRLREEVIGLWEEVDRKFCVERRPKRRIR